MKIKYLLIFTILFLNFCEAQKVKLSDLHGTWVSGLRESNFIVFVNDTIVGLDFYEMPNVYINYSKVGFVDSRNPILINFYKKKRGIKNSDNKNIRIMNFDIPDNLNIEIMTEQKNEDDYFYDGGTLCGLGIDAEDLPSKVGSRIELINSNVFVYIKVDKLPDEYALALYKKGKKDNRNYIKEFFNSEFKTIKSPKATIYTAPNQPTKMYLVKGDEVECLEEQESWYKIRYYGKKTIEGWVKKEDIIE